MRKDCDQEQRNNVGDLDRRIDSRAGRILVGVADSITCHRCLMRIRTLQMLHTVLINETIFEALLRIVPSAATRGHRDCNEETIDDHAQERCTKCCSYW